MKATRIILATLFLTSPILSAADLSDQAIRLRNQGIAELENEAPAKAEETFKELIRMVPDDPLGYANLAIATLRQQRFEEAQEWIGKALEKASGDPQLLAIEAEVHHWSGDNEKALDSLKRAAQLAPDDQEIQYSLYRQATTMVAGEEEEAASAALERLAELRPENVVVLLQLGERARQRGDRAAASSVYLRVRELIWQAPPGAETLLDQVLQGLEEGDLDSLRAPSLRLANVLKIAPMYKEGLRELSRGIQGNPITRFRGEPPVESWGDPAEVRFRTSNLSPEPTAAAGLATGDLDGDETLDLVRLVDGEPMLLEVRFGSLDGDSTATVEAPGIERILLADLDNDGRVDILGYGPSDFRLWRAEKKGALLDATGDSGLERAGGRAAVAFDFDIEGDLDLALAGGGGSRPPLALYRNSLSGPLEEVSAKSFPKIELQGLRDAQASDLDRDGDLDLVLAHEAGIAWLDNLRQGRFADRSSAITDAKPVQRLASADFDNDGFPDLVGVARGVHFWHNKEGRFAPWDLGKELRTSVEFIGLAVFDADNDGHLDLAVAGEQGLTVLAQRAEGRFDFLPLEEAPHGATALSVADFDGDGDVDLLAGGPTGLHLLDNEGGNRNRWLSVRLRGLVKGNSKNNILGSGAVVEVRTGRAYQFREATGGVTHFGLGQIPTPDLLRVVWTNGVPQNRLQPSSNQRIVEEQLLKGSCPFLYAWTGEGFDFVTDLLWGAPAGLPLAEGVYMGADAEELVRVDGLSLRDGGYEISITEELWEAAFIDVARLWVVDHPTEVEVASSLRIQPGASVPEKVLGSREILPVAGAWDARGQEVTARIRQRDEVYADGWRRSPYQGVAAEPWVFTFDLGQAPGQSVRLLLDGWIFPTDASLNLALAQQRALAPFPPRLEVETTAGWQTLIDSMGFPAGKTKTMVIDTPPLPRDSRKLRIVSGQWLSWDRIAWTTHTADDEPVVRARLQPKAAELRYRGFSALVRQAPNAPHSFDYERASLDSPWLPFPGRYTRYGDVRELLLDPDDRSVILGPGDEMAVVFDASQIPPPAAGWTRTLFLESHGWDKDAHRNTWEGDQVEPLPFRAMSGYPYRDDEAFPDTPLHRDYLENWLTRIVEPEPPGPGIESPAP
jgi:Flp pilus assembly protein TadD